MDVCYEFSTSWVVLCFENGDGNSNVCSYIVLAVQGPKKLLSLVLVSCPARPLHCWGCVCRRGSFDVNNLVSSLHAGLYHFSFPKSSFDIVRIFVSSLEFTLFGVIASFFWNPFLFSTFNHCLSIVTFCCSASSCPSNQHNWPFTAINRC